MGKTTRAAAGQDGSVFSGASADALEERGLGARLPNGTLRLSGLEKEYATEHGWLGGAPTPKSKLAASREYRVYSTLRRAGYAAVPVAARETDPARDGFFLRVWRKGKRRADEPAAFLVLVAGGEWRADAEELERLARAAAEERTEPVIAVAPEDNRSGNVVFYGLKRTRFG